MTIIIRGASEHNLQDLDVDFPSGLTVVTGVSGSGKTSLVFDTLYHEARRRFLEIFALGSSRLRLAPVKVQVIQGLGPAVAVGQNLLNRNPNSTLATASGLHPFIRLLFANFGDRSCPRCGASLTLLSEDEIVHKIASLTREGSVKVFAPLLHQSVGSHHTLLEILVTQFGKPSLWIDGQPWQPKPLHPGQPHDIEVELAELSHPVTSRQVRQVVEQAASLGVQAVKIRRKDESWTLSQAPVCTQCGTWFSDLLPVHFHSPCPDCQGKGCPRCAGTGLHPEAAATRWHGQRLPELLSHSVEEVHLLFQPGYSPASAGRLQSEIFRRLEALREVGLGYLTLDRPSPTLSRGEAQRVRLAVALTSRLEDMLHVLDEPTIGQHPADVAHLLPAFRKLAGPVIYVEHDRLAASAADSVIDLGPGAGKQGGRLLFSGTPASLWRADTPTGRYFSGRLSVTTPAWRPPPDEFLVVREANLRNLANIDVTIPLGRLTVITGVSGSGKSTFVEDVLVASLLQGKPVGCREIEGPQLKPVFVDQSPIGINPRSNPATYTKLSDTIRDLFAAQTGFSPSHFSFNRPEGACPVCEGMGAIEVHMRYLPSTWIECSECAGQRFSDEILAQKASFGEQQLSIADFYELSVAEVLPLLTDHPDLPKGSRHAARQILEALFDIGLGYLPLGQPSPSLSGGEAQRVKLAKYLGRRSLKDHFLILDEPSTGLHPQDIAGLLAVLDRLVRSGGTILVVEHNTDVIRAADWVIDLGPGAGPAGGKLMYAGPLPDLLAEPDSLTGTALRAERTTQPPVRTHPRRASRTKFLSIRGARANNLRNVSVDFPKAAITVVTGVSGSGKSSLVSDVLETEARRRYLESLSMYERQSTREGPEAPVESVRGLGVAITVSPERRVYERRATVGTATELSHHLAVLLAEVGQRRCLSCGTFMIRGQMWTCPECGASAPLAEPRHFLPSNYAAACLTCHGVGTMQIPAPQKLIIHPEKPLLNGAMYSPGFFPKGYLGKPYNGGYDMVQALARRYRFDPFETPWQEMTSQAQEAFLFGDPEPMEITFYSRTGRTRTHVGHFPGFYGWIRDWDVGGTYTTTQACPDCQGAGLRQEYTAVTLNGHDIRELSEMPLVKLAESLQDLAGKPEGRRKGKSEARESRLAGPSLDVSLRRLRFLIQVGLGYLHLHRPAGTLSAGEAQRIRLAGLLGSELTSLTVLLDEPTRGLHPSEVEALLGALMELRRLGNTVILVEHDPQVIQSADYLIDMGPGAGIQGGQVVARGTPEEVMRTNTLTAQWLRGERAFRCAQSRRPPHGWLVVRGARANNLHGEMVRFPKGTLTGVCGVSGSGKSTLVIDTLGRALAPKKQTTSVAHEPIQPGEHDAIDDTPARTVVVDQVRAGIGSPADFLNLTQGLQHLYAESEAAKALGWGSDALARRCSACGGSGSIRTDMGFLPSLHTPCDTCQGTGFLAEAWDVQVKGLSLPEVFNLTIDQVYELFGEEDTLRRLLEAAQEVGLGYLVLRQPDFSLSGGEAQRLKVARELSRRTANETLYILDEPTVGQHLEDVQRLIAVLHRLVEAGHSVLVVEHHPHLLASCDWLVELGPGGGPDGGQIIATGTPEMVADGQTPMAPYLRRALEGQL